MVTEAVKVCSHCLEAKTANLFAEDRSRPDGLTYWCRDCRNARYQPTTRPPAPRGRVYVDARGGDKKQARRRINHLVDMGILPKPNDVPCTDCGHVGPDRRHEYDHYLGYEAAHHEDVQAVCSSCHHARERLRHG